MKIYKPKGEYIEGLIGMGVFFLAWIGLLILLKATAVRLGASVDMANGVVMAVLMPVAGAVLLTGDTDRFNQIGRWAYTPSRNRE